MLGMKCERQSHVQYNAVKAIQLKTMSCSGVLSLLNMPKCPGCFNQCGSTLLVISH